MVSGPPASLIVSASSTDEDCGLDNGTATSSPYRSRMGRPYTYAWSTGSSATSLSGLSVGTYTVSVTDAGGCESTASAVVNAAGTTLAGSTSSTDEVCTTLGSASVVATGGASPYTYAWSSGGTSASETGLSAGTYSVTITDVTDVIFLKQLPYLTDHTQ